ncbi:MAG: hypothetical protein GC164_10090 [Phycisphaera sp.]|nr:hypothetical protein [Phycisphaera sp.]
MLLLATATSFTGGCALIQNDHLGPTLDAQLALAGDNAAQLRRALADVPDNQREGLRFLIAYMPERDLKSLSAKYLLDNVRLAYLARNQSPWAKRIPDDLFLNDVLPYAVINEQRDEWRAGFYTRFHPLVADAKSPGEAATILNRKIFDELNVHFSRKRPKADQSPMETIQAGMASCTGLSILLIDACRAVGVPARLVGTPLWVDKSGNHSWVEVWDGDWHFTGADEAKGNELDRGWFARKATTALRDEPMHAIYATSFKPTGVHFPLVWDLSIDDVHAVNVTDRYAKDNPVKPALPTAEPFDVEASLHALAQLKKYLLQDAATRPRITDQDFASVPLSQTDAELAYPLLRDDLLRQTGAQPNGTDRLLGPIAEPWTITKIMDKLNGLSKPDSP